MISRKNMLALLGVGVSAFVLSSSGALAAETHEQRLAKAASAKEMGSSASADVALERARREAAEKMVAQLQAENQANDDQMQVLEQQLAAAMEKANSKGRGKDKDKGPSEADMKKSQEEIAALNAQLAEMRAARAEADAKIDQMKVQLLQATEANAKATQLQNQLASKVSSGWEAQQQVDIERARREAAERAMAELQSANLGRDRQLQEVQQQLSKTQAIANDPQAAVEKARRQATESELQKAKSAATAADSENIRLARENAAMQQQMAQLKAMASNDKMTQTAGQLAALEQRNSELMAQLNAARAQSEAAAKASVMTTNNDAATNARIAELGQKSAANQAEFQALLEAEKLRRQKLEALLAQGGTGDAAARMSEMAAQVADLTQKNAALEQRLASEGASAPLVAGMPANAPANAQVAALQQQLSTAKSNNAALAEKLAAQGASGVTAAQVAALQKQLNVMKGDNEMLAGKLAAAKAAPVPAAPATPAPAQAAPVAAAPTVYNGDEQLAAALAETKSALASAKAEKEEYRNLLQRERLEAKTAPANPGTENERIAKLETERADLIRKLEFEKSKNEGAGISSGGEPSGVVKDMQDRLAKLEDERNKLEKQLKVTQADVIQARAQNAAQTQAQAPAAPVAPVASAPAASMPVPQVAVSSVSVPDADVQTLVTENKRLQAELAASRPVKADAGAMQSEIASLRAQNNVLNNEVSKRLAAAPDRAAMNNAAAEANYKVAQAQAAVSADMQKAQARYNAVESENIRLAKELATARTQAAAAQAPVLPAPVAMQAPQAAPVVQPSHISRPENPRDMMPVAQPVMAMPLPAMPVAATQVAYAPATANIGPSGADISGYLRRAGIPMVSGFEKVSRVSGPQFSAFRWDTGTVFGTAEQEIMPSDAAFQQGVNAYLSKTRQRCGGTFDQSFDAGQFAQHKDFAVADVACVMPDGTGAGAAMVFYYKDGMFNVIAHEGDITQFEQAMGTRDSFARFMQGVL